MPSETDSMVGGHGAEKYRPILEIGRGGMSRVYVSLVRGMGDFSKLQVIKRLLPTLAADPDFLQMFLDEARLSARLNHANIVQINEVGFDGLHYFMAMEYLEGQSFETIIRRAQATKDPAFTVPMQLRIIADACAGLHHAHELTDIDGKPLDIVHRDVSPHNIFVTYSGQVKVLDFGIAKAADSAHHTRTGVLKGKCTYMSPEQFRGSEGIDRRADIFALGVMLWQATTGTRLWKGLSDVEIFYRLTHGLVPSPLSEDPNLPAPLVSICNRALECDRAQRYRTAAEVAEAIEGYLDTLPSSPASRDIGRWVTESFKESRAKVNQAIETELRKHRPSSSEIPIYVDPDAPPPDEYLPPTRVANDLGSNDPPSGTSAPHDEVPLPPSAGSGFRAFKALVVVGGLVAIVLGAIVLLGKKTPSETSSTSPAMEVGDPEPAANVAKPDGEERNFTTLHVNASPDTTKLYVDEVPLSSNPGSARFLRDRLAHRIRGEAPGYKGHVEIVVYDHLEERVSFHLERDTPAAVRPPPIRVPISKAPKETTAPAPTSDPSPTVTSPPAAPSSNKPQLDRDPWHYSPQ